MIFKPVSHFYKLKSGSIVPVRIVSQGWPDHMTVYISRSCLLSNFIFFLSFFPLATSLSWLPIFFVVETEWTVALRQPIFI